jgi:hypothetical protein
MLRVALLVAVWLVVVGCSIAVWIVLALAVWAALM